MHHCAQDLEVEEEGEEDIAVVEEEEDTDQVMPQVQTAMKFIVPQGLMVEWVLLLMEAETRMLHVPLPLAHMALVRHRHIHPLLHLLPLHHLHLTGRRSQAQHLPHAEVSVRHNLMDGIHTALFLVIARDLRHQESAEAKHLIGAEAKAETEVGAEIGAGAEVEATAEEGRMNLAMEEAEDTAKKEEIAGQETQEALPKAGVGAEAETEVAAETEEADRVTTATTPAIIAHTPAALLILRLALCLLHGTHLATIHL